MRIRIAAAPEDGKANTCLCGFLSKALSCPKRDIKIISGERSKAKTLSIPASCTEKLKEIVFKDGH